MKSYIPFNINSHVRVKVTELGHKQHRQRHDDLLGMAQRQGADLEAHPWPYRPLEVDAEGWTRMQAWEVMQTWGPHMGNGFPVPIETNIEIEIENPERTE